MNFKILLFLIIATPLVSQNPVFFREKIELNIYQDRCCIKGIYYFKNPDDLAANRMLYYPFSFNHNLMTPDSISVILMPDQKAIAFSQADQGILFQLFIPARGESEYQVVYWQKAPLQKIEYILTTTAIWGRPLQQADLVVRLLPGLKLKFLSMDWDRVEESAGGVHYFITRYQFLPDSNLIVEWGRR